MCRAKSDPNIPGGRRCPSHAKQHLAIIDRKLMEVEAELQQNQKDFQTAFDEQIQESIMAHFRRLGEQKQVLLAEKKQTQMAINLSPTTIEKLRSHAETLTDETERDEVLARANAYEKQYEQQKEEKRTKYLKQAALTEVMREANVPEHEIIAFQESLASDTGSSNLRSYNNYFDKLCRAEDQLEIMKASYETSNNEIEARRDITDEKRWDMQDANSDHWEQTIREQKVKIAQIKFQLYQTDAKHLKIGDSKMPSGLVLFDQEAEREVLAREKKIDQFYEAHQDAMAKKLDYELCVYQGKQIAMRKRIVQAREVRLSDRQIRDNIKPRIKAIMTEAGSSPEQIQKALDAYTDPESFMKAKAVENYWNSKKTVLMHLTEEEAEEVETINADDRAKNAVRTPKLPQGQTLQQVHDSFVRHKNGGAHRQPTVQGVRREIPVLVTLKRKELAVVDGYANAIGVSRSSYLRSQIAPDRNPFELLNDRSDATRKSMKAKAAEFLQSRQTIVG